MGSGPLDAEEILMHPFFQEVDFERLMNKQVTPPYPYLVNTQPSKYFHTTFHDTPS